MATFGSIYGGADESDSDESASDESDAESVTLSSRSPLPPLRRGSQPSVGPQPLQPRPPQYPRLESMLAQHSFAGRLGRDPTPHYLTPSRAPHRLEPLSSSVAPAAAAHSRSGSSSDTDTDEPPFSERAAWLHAGAQALPGFAQNAFLSAASAPMSEANARELELVRRSAVIEQAAMDSMLPRAAEARRNAERSETVASVTSKIGTVASFTPAAPVAPVLSMLSGIASVNAARHRGDESSAFDTALKYAGNESSRGHLLRHQRVAESHQATNAWSAASSVPVAGVLALPGVAESTYQQLAAYQERVKHTSGQSRKLARQQMANEEAEAANTFPSVIFPEERAASRGSEP